MVLNGGTLEQVAETCYLGVDADATRSMRAKMNYRVEGERSFIGF